MHARPRQPAGAKHHHTVLRSRLSSTRARACVREPNKPKQTSKPKQHYKEPNDDADITAGAAGSFVSGTGTRVPKPFQVFIQESNPIHVVQAIHPSTLHTCIPWAHSTTNQKTTYTTNSCQKKKACVCNTLKNKQAKDVLAAVHCRTYHDITLPKSVRTRVVLLLDNPTADQVERTVREGWLARRLVGWSVELFQSSSSNQWPNCNCVHIPSRILFQHISYVIETHSNNKIINHFFILSVARMT